MISFVYVLESLVDGGWYIGRTADLKRRLSEHNCGKSIYTNKKKPWRLIYFEGYLDLTDCRGREEYLKSGPGRTRLKAQLSNYLKRKGKL